MTRAINIGILGCAQIAEKAVIPELKKLKNHFNIVGVASRTLKRANQFSSKFNLKPFNGYQSLIEHDQVEAVYIPLPNSLHFEWISKALLAGKHVIVEKSLACNYEEAVSLNLLASQKGVVLIENFQFRFHSQLQKLMEMVQDGKIGEIRNMRASFGFPPFPDQNNIRYQKSLGGGALLDAGAYPIKISQVILGNDLVIASSQLAIDPDRNVDIWGSALLVSKSKGVVSQIAFGFDHAYQCSVELWGSKGILSTDRIFTAPPGFTPTFKLITQNGSEEILLAEDNHFRNMLLHFHDLVRMSKGQNDEYQQNINQARLIEEVRTLAK
jgi:NDP-hexose-3-ketoreductase